jgi:hypothetical protein
MMSIRVQFNCQPGKVNLEVPPIGLERFLICPRSLVLLQEHIQQDLFQQLNKPRSNIHRDPKVLLQEHLNFRISLRLFQYYNIEQKFES